MKWANVEIEGKVWCGLVEGDAVLPAAEGCLSQHLADLGALEAAARLEQVPAPFFEVSARLVVPLINPAR